ncbi:hypothetical protein CRE_28103 [Caenorhabditis remanei]|uniref:Uncharacterized protein n=1 Tax=Caenorhabditis remanei TaxID=31234 RepID=E3LMB0_CAERE|nr:hypothetical protein CRE_28103 [Caenorhabditis remanei]
MNPPQTARFPIFNIPEGAFRTLNSHWCPSKKVHSIALPNINGFRVYYHLENGTGKMIQLDCVECQPIIYEQHLLPFQSIFCKELNNQLIFVKNYVTLQIEQYVFCPATGGFIQVDLPNYTPDMTKISASNVIFNLNHPRFGKFSIQKDVNGVIRKLVHNENARMYVPIQPLCVRTLSIQKMEKVVCGEIKPDVIDESYRYYISKCSHFQTICFGVAYNGNSYKFTHDEKNGSFTPFQCKRCINETTETGLSALYSVYHEHSKQYVIFARNGMNYQVEQFIYNDITTGFEQRDYKDLIYNNNFDHLKPHEFLCININETTKDVTVIKKKPFGLEKVRCDGEKNTFAVLPEFPVKLLRPFMIIDRPTEMITYPNSIQNTTKDILQEVVPDTLEDFQTLSINQKKKKKSKLYEVAYIRTSF